jgi:hypothetical protein
MQHDERIIHEPPVIPLAACPEHVREALGLAPLKRASVTRDGRLQCGCDATGCTCKTTATRDPAQAPGRRARSRRSACFSVSKNSRTTTLKSGTLASFRVCHAVIVPFKGAKLPFPSWAMVISRCYINAPPKPERTITPDTGRRRDPAHFRATGHLSDLGISALYELFAQGVSLHEAARRMGISYRGAAGRRGKSPAPFEIYGGR